MPRGQGYKRTRQYGVKVGGAVNLSKQQYKMNADLKYLKTVVNAEMNYFIFSNSNNIDSTGRIDSLCNVVQGVTHNDRTGTSILPRYLSINMNISKNVSAGPTHEVIRVILFRYWGEQTSSAPAVSITEVLQSSSVYSHLNDDNTGARGDRERRIEIHKNKLFNLDQVGDTKRVFKWNVQVNGPNKKVKDHIKYRANITEQPVSGGFYLLILTDNATGANKSAFEIESKLNFYDN